MNDYSDIFFLMGSMVMLSLLTGNTIRTYATANDSLIRSELEYRIMTAAQDEIDAVRWVDSSDELKSANPNYVFANYPHTKTISFGSSDQYSDQVDVSATVTLVENTSTMERYEISITASSTYLTPAVSTTLNYIKSFKK